MSRYESSKFIKDPRTMNQDALKQACETLGWKYKVEKNILYVTDAKQSSEMYGEYVLKVEGDTVTYNSYYLDNGQQLIEELQETFFPLNVEYAKKSVVDAFSRNGFTFQRIWRYAKKENEVERFAMVGYTKNPTEPEKRFEIVFSIFKDGTVVTDSNYLPDDVNELAHKSMDDLQKLFGNDRVMTKKPEYDIFMRTHKRVNTTTTTIKS